MRKIALFSLVLLSSCALFSSSNESITITTSNGKPAYCLLKNDEGSWRGYSGKPIEIKSSLSDLKVTCAMNGLRAAKIVKAEAGKKGYPEFVMVTLKSYKKKTGGKVNDQDAPDDNDESNDPSLLNNSDAVDDAKPLNVLPDAPEDAEDKVVIIRHN